MATNTNPHPYRPSATPVGEQPIGQLGVQTPAKAAGQAPRPRAARPTVSNAPGTLNVSGSSAAPAGPTGPSASGGAPHGRALQKKGGTPIALVVVGCVVAALALWLLIWLFACNGSGMFDPNAQSGQAPYKSAEEVQAELDRQVEEGMFNISIASTIQFADGTSNGTAYIENVPGNRYNMQVVITDDATGDVLYESGVLAPNQFIEDIALAKDLEPGLYDATATFKAMDPTTYEEAGQAAAKISINVLG